MKEITEQKVTTKKNHLLGWKLAVTESLRYVRFLATYKTRALTVTIEGRSM